MSSTSTKCCIVGCQATDVHYHRFPNPGKDLVRFNKWLDILNIDELRLMDSTSVFNNRRICSAHFDPKYTSPRNPRLHWNALPTLEQPLTSVNEQGTIRTDSLPVSPVQTPVIYKKCLI